MPCCWGHHYHCCWYPWPAGEIGPRWRRRPGPAREYDLEDLEEEREMLHARLRRLERELEELRRGGGRLEPEREP